MSAESAASPGVVLRREPVPVVVVFSGLMLVLLLAALDNTIVATALPTIVGELGGLEHISWITSSYLLAQTAVTPLYGKLGISTGASASCRARSCSSWPARRCAG